MSAQPDPTGWHEPTWHAVMIPPTGRLLGWKYHINGASFEYPVDLELGAGDTFTQSYHRGWVRFQTITKDGSARDTNWFRKHDNDPN